MSSDRSSTGAAELKNKLPANRPTLTAADMKRPGAELSTIRNLIEGQKAEIARALPKHLDADRLARIAFTTIRSTPAIARCTPESLLGGLMTCAQLGLEPGPLGHAYFVPYKNEVTFILGYRGMIELALRSGKIKSLIAREVYERDTFEVEYGLEDRLVHRPEIVGQRGDVIAYYAVAKFDSGGHAFVVMSKPDIDKVRKRSRASDNGPWATDYDAMAKKTCVRRLFNYLPTSVEMQQALSQDGQVRLDIKADALDEPPAYIEGQIVDTDDAGLVDAGTGEVVDADVEPPSGEGGGWPPVAEVGA